MNVCEYVSGHKVINSRGVVNRTDGRSKSWRIRDADLFGQAKVTKSPSSTTPARLRLSSSIDGCTRNKAAKSGSSSAKVILMHERDRKVNWLVERMHDQASKYNKEIGKLEDEIALRERALQQLWSMFPAVEAHFNAILETERHRAETGATRNLGSPAKSRRG